MCGICGFQGRFTEPLLQRMTSRLRERGPDGGAVAMRLSADGTTVTGLGHRRLAVVDLTTSGLQPMVARCVACGTASEDDEVMICFNGELYDFENHRAQLQARGHAFHSRTDTEVILHLWASHGFDMLPKLNGIFAFALREGRRTGRPSGVEYGDLILVRDPIGVKPLYVAELPEGMLFASELKALLEHPGLPLDIDLTAVHETLAFLWTPGPRTMFTSVQKLAPGEVLIVRDGRVVRRWTYAPILYDGTRTTGTQEELNIELRDILTRAVRRQLVADVPVGAFLSGGLDSSAIVALMREAQPGTPFETYCISFSEDEDVEGNPSDAPYARKVAKHLNVKLHELVVDESIIEDLPRLIWLLDEPQADLAPLNALRIAERARADGIPVLMSGAGGDDIFSGYRRHQALALDSTIRRLPHSLRAALGRLARRAAANGLPSGGVSPLLRRLLKLSSQLDQEGDAYLASQFLWSTDNVRLPLFTEAARQRIGSASVTTPLTGAIDRLVTDHDRLNRMLFLETRFFLADHNLNYTDKTGMAHGVEVRVPLLDLEVVSFAAKMPTAMKLDGTLTKAAFRRTMEPLLPREVIYRPKSGFGAPVRRWLRGPLRAFVEESLSPTRLLQRGIFEPAAVARLRQLDAAGRVDGSLTILALIVFEIWCKQFVDGGRPPLKLEQLPHV